MNSFKTRKITFKSYDDLDEQLNALRKVGYRPVLLHSEEQRDTYEAWITFEVTAA